MFGFTLGNKKIIGIDVGYSALKVVELEVRNDRPYLTNYGWMPVQDILGGDRNAIGSEFFANFSSKCLKKIVEEAKFKAREAYVAIPSLGGLITLIDFPAMPLEDMEQAMRFEAQKYIPTSLDEVVTSWEIVGGGGKENKFAKKDLKNTNEKVQVLLVAASKKKILAYEKIAKDAELKLSGIEMENISIVSSLIGKDEGNFIIVDVGFRICNIIYIEKGVIKANRNIDAGGMDLTKTISTGLGISKERAEAMKLSGKDFFSMESSLHFSTLDVIVGEILRILGTLPGNGKNVDSIILSGGTANFAKLTDFFQKKLGIRTIVGNAFSRIDYDKRLEPAISKIKSRFSVAIGLALKGIENKTK